MRRNAAKYPIQNTDFPNATNIRCRTQHMCGPPKHISAIAPRNLNRAWPERSLRVRLSLESTSVALRFLITPAGRVNKRTCPAAERQPRKAI